MPTEFWKIVQVGSLIATPVIWIMLYKHSQRSLRNAKKAVLQLVTEMSIVNGVNIVFLLKRNHGIQPHDTKRAIKHLTKDGSLKETPFEYNTFCYELSPRWECH